MFLEAALEFAREASIYEARVHFLRRSSRRLSPSACNEFIKMPPPADGGALSDKGKLDEFTL